MTFRLRRRENFRDDPCRLRVLSESRRGDSRAGLAILGQIASVDPADAGKISTEAAKAGIHCRQIGTVGGNQLSIDDIISVSLKELKDVYENSFPAQG